VQVFSYSCLDKFQRCPAAFYQKYVLERPEPATEALVLGKAAHAVIEAAMQAVRDDEDFFRVVSRAVAAVTGVDEEELFHLTWKPPVRLQVGPGNRVEEHFQVPLDPDDPFSPEVQGYIDLWRDDGDPEIQLIDWKTNRKPYHPLDTHQLGLYAGYLSRVTGKPVRARLVFLRTGDTLQHVYSADDIAAAWTWAAWTAIDIQERLFKAQTEEPLGRGWFPATPGDACRYCGYAAACDGSGISFPGEIREPAEAEILGREILRLEAVLDALKERLRGFVEHHGPVRVDGREFRLATSQYWKWPQEALAAAVDAMRKDGIDPLTVLSLTATGLKKLPWDEEKIRSLGANPGERRDFKHLAAKGATE